MSLALLTACTVETNEETKKLDMVIGDPISGAVREINKQSLALVEKAEKRDKEAKNAQMVKVWVRAKDTRTCMKLLKIDTINNEVVECNKDRFVLVRNDEVEQFKKDEGL